MSSDPNTERIPSKPSSPRWSSTTKAVVGFTLIAIVAALLIRFRVIIAPLFAAVILAYLLHPIATFMQRRLKLSWRLASVILLLFLLIIVLGSLTLGGLAIFNQIQSLITFIQKQIVLLPDFVSQITSKPIVISLFEIQLFQIDLTTLNATNLANQLLGLIQPILTNTANILGSIATGAVSTIGWLLFTVLVSYFMLSDSGGVRNQMINISIPGYQEDMTRLRHELGNIWNAFLRNQIILFFLTVLIYVIVLGSLQVNFYLGLAIVAGLARFVPYVGPWVTWITYGLVTFFQGTTIFGLEPFPYVILVCGIAMLIDLAMDNFLVPRMMGDSLKIHPAAVMVAAIVFANLFGIIGVFLAAPVMATVKLISNYVILKLFDQDPWIGFETRKIKPLPPIFRYIGAHLRRFSRWLKNKIGTRWPAGIPIFNWIQDKFRWVVNKLGKKSDTSTTR